ncbi:Type 1 glutamine amidotransferase-like domain-containing protein [Leekyejoonella antrihumi]|uniref:Type 1 glutamine amidotransferase-like domain-containing protein n=1 Tax=Leekyejoonella antrihumi TaxID=1660198 RepID=UPI00164509E2|nr:Type 1 glutamine amidotransferase-like domain-containing protein [Leekyejoonella antrihumi]
MRLYLSSYQLGNHPELFSALVRGERRGWVVMNALDGLDNARRIADTQTQIDNLASIGLIAENLDLRDLTPSEIRDVFGQPDFVWVRGGNVFTLRMAMARSGLDDVIVEGLATDDFVYAGFSAGPCVLAPSLAGLELCDSPSDCRAVYGDVRFDGLAVLDRPVVPHLCSPAHPETEILATVAARYETERRPFWALRDGQALIVDGSTSRIRS